jgi:hypothetical protein
MNDEISLSSDRPVKKQRMMIAAERPRTTEGKKRLYSRKRNEARLMNRKEFQLAEEVGRENTDAILPEDNLDSSLAGGPRNSNAPGPPGAVLTFSSSPVLPWLFLLPSSCRSHSG